MRSLAAMQAASEPQSRTRATRPSLLATNISSAEITRRPSRVWVARMTAS